jgi:NAD(P)-dependent dehydrogenase (short-subunit alcohol dehydrogenase family)
MGSEAKAAIVTRSAGGIGKAAARAIAQRARIAVAQPDEIASVTAFLTSERERMQEQLSR